MNSSNNHGSSNYHSQQRHYFLASDSIKSRGQQRQSATNPPTTMAAANGLPPMPLPSASSATAMTTFELSQQQHSLARQQQHQHQQQQHINNHSKGYPRGLQASQQQQQLRHFYGPIESMTMHGTNMNSTHHRQDQPIVFTANQSAVASGQQHSSMGRHIEAHASRPASGSGEYNFNTSTVRSRAEPHHYPDGTQYQQQNLQHRSGPSDTNHQHGQHAKQLPHPYQERSFGTMTERSPCDNFSHDDHLEPAMTRLEHEQRDQYANQLRRSQQRIGLQSQQHHQQAGAKLHGSKTSSPSYPSPSTSKQMQASQTQHQCQQMTDSSSDNKNTQFGQQQPPQQNRESLHVNFNRSSQRGANEGADDESGETTRKKKYLTAKYGQQQMNLIKKRLKIEMWLHDQLQELAKLSKSIEQDELDNIDIDLDQLLDMDDDSTRRHWLRKTLEPLGDLPNESIEKFVSDVLEQSKLL